MDSKKLDALRQKYSEAKGGDIFDPEFAAVAAQVFTGTERRKWPFADPATFLGLPFRPDALAQPGAKLDVAVIGVPMDLGVTNRAGARLGPRAVRAVERIGPYEHVLRIAPHLHLAAADIGDLSFTAFQTGLAGTGILHNGALDIDIAVAGNVSNGVITGTVSNSFLGQGTFNGKFSGTKAASGTYRFDIVTGTKLTGTWNAAAP